MKAVVIGLGSMGKRRIELMREMYPELPIVGIDTREDRRNEAAAQYDIETAPSLACAPEDVDCAFVCTSPLSHAALTGQCLSKGWHVFTELNLIAEGYDENIRLAREKSLRLFLSAPFLYREETCYLCSQIHSNRPWNYIYHIGQYLPDWHPWENYQDFFVSDKRTNACREILSIELPWLFKSFGEVSHAEAVSGKMTGLKISFSDYFLIRIEHKNGSRGVLAVDIVSPVAVRKFEAYGENAYLSWDGTPESISEFDPQTKTLERVKLREAAEHKEGYRPFIVENMYKNEIRAFFDSILTQKEPEYGFEQNKAVLSLLDSLGV